MKLIVTPEFPGSSGSDGTFENPCQAGSLRLRCRHKDNTGAVKFNYSIKWGSAKYCMAKAANGDKVILNKFNNFGWEGANPFFGLPPTHNRKNDPAIVHIKVMAKDGLNHVVSWEQTVYYYTKLCQCRFMDDYGPDWLDWDMWRRRGFTLGKFYMRIRCLGDNRNVSTDRVYHKIMSEKWPEVFKSGMFGPVFSGTEKQLLAGIDEAEKILEEKLNEKEPLKKEFSTIELTEDLVKDAEIKADFSEEALDKVPLVDDSFREAAQKETEIRFIKEQVERAEILMGEIQGSLKRLLAVLHK